jgi:hypothetical protein
MLLEVKHHTGVLAEREVGQDFDEEQLPFGDEGAMCPDGDWAEQCQKRPLTVGSEPVPDVLVQVGVRALDLGLTTHSGPDHQVRAAAW